MLATNNYTIKRPGLYLITPDGFTSKAGSLDQLAAVLRSDTVALLQYRDKSADHKAQKDYCVKLLPLCRAAGTPLIINDDMQLAAELEADGVHLGKTDGSIQAARKLLGEHAIIGASCYNQLDLAIEANRAGADYLAFGSMFSSQTKPEAVKCPLSLLAEAKNIFCRPIVAIGGITIDNASTIIDAGADWLALISDIFSAPHPVQKLAEYHQLFTTIRNTDHA